MAAVAAARELLDLGLVAAALVAELEVPGLAEVRVQAEVGAAEGHHGAEEDPPLTARLLEYALRDLVDAKTAEVLLERRVPGHHVAVVGELDALEVVDDGGGDVRSGRGNVVERDTEVGELPRLGVDRPEVHRAPVAVGRDRVLLHPERVALEVCAERQVQRRDLVGRLAELEGGRSHLLALLAGHEGHLRRLELVVLEHRAVAAHVVGLAADAHLVVDGERPAEALRLDDLVAEVRPEGGLHPPGAPAIHHEELAAVGPQDLVGLHEATGDRRAHEHLVGATEAAGVVRAEAVRCAQRVERLRRDVGHDDHRIRVLHVERGHRHLTVAAVITLEEAREAVGLAHDRPAVELRRVHFFTRNALVITSPKPRVRVRAYYL